MPEENKPSVWIGCLACYNEGHLLGEWYDLNDAQDVTVEMLHETVRRPVGSHEELWVFDKENLPIDGECSPLDIAPWATAYERLGDDLWPAFCAWEHSGEDTEQDASLEAFEDQYAGRWESFADYARENRSPTTPGTWPMALPCSMACAKRSPDTSTGRHGPGTRSRSTRQPSHRVAGCSSSGRSSSLRSTLYKLGLHMDRLRVPGADHRDQLRQRHAQRMGDPVEGADFRGNAPRLDLDDRLAVHSCGFGQPVDRHALFAAGACDLDAEGMDIGYWGGHASTLPQARSLHSNLNAPIFDRFGS